MTWSGYSPDENERTFDDYYEKAKDELTYFDMNAWGNGPSKEEINNRAAQLALENDSVDYDEYQERIQYARGGYWDFTPTEAQLIVEARGFSQSSNEREERPVEPPVELKSKIFHSQAPSPNFFMQYWHLLATAACFTFMCASFESKNIDALGASIINKFTDNVLSSSVNIVVGLIAVGLITFGIIYLLKHAKDYLFKKDKIHFPIPEALPRVSEYSGALFPNLIVARLGNGEVNGKGVASLQHIS